MSCFLFTCLTNCLLRHVDCYVMLVTSFWRCWRLFLSCVRYGNIYHTHTVGCKYYHSSIIAIIWTSITSVALFSRTCRSVTLSACCLDGLMCLIIKSCWVCVRKLTHVWNHSFTHLVIFSKPYWLDHPPIARPPLSHTTKSQPSMIMYSCQELRRAWGCSPGILHYAILESTWMNLT